MSMEAPFVVAKAPSVVQGISTWHSRHTVEDFTARVTTYRVFEPHTWGTESDTECGLYDYTYIKVQKQIQVRIMVHLRLE